MSGPREKVSFILGDITLSLYPQDENGVAVLASPIWFGACAESIRVTERWIGVETRPGGRKQPHRRAQVAQYSIDIDRVWTLQKSALDDFKAGPGPYVLDAVWQDEDDYWHRKTFYGVTPAERSWSADSPESAMHDAQQWNAESVQESSPSASVPPPAVEYVIPLVVSYVTPPGRSVDIYTHDADAWSFTETEAGITAGRAALVYAPTNMAGKFEVIFATGSTVALRVTAGQVLEVGTLVRGTPTTADTPRVEFLVAGERVAAVSLAKKFFVPGIDEVSAPAAGGRQFQIKANSLLSLVLSRAKAGCLEVRESL